MTITVALPAAVLRRHRSEERTHVAHDKNQIQSTVKGYLLAEFLPGEDASLLTPTTPLISAGILDSIGTLKLVTYLEETFNVQIEAHEADMEHLDTLDDIARLVMSKG